MSIAKSKTAQKRELQLKQEKYIINESALDRWLWNTTVPRFRAYESALIRLKNAAEGHSAFEARLIAREHSGMLRKLARCTARLIELNADRGLILSPIFHCLNWLFAFTYFYSEALGRYIAHLERREGLTIGFAVQNEKGEVAVVQATSEQLLEASKKQGDEHDKE